LFCYVEDRPMTDLRSWKSLLGRNSNGYFSATNHLIHFQFGSRVGLSGSANLTVPFIVTHNWTSLPWQQNLGQNVL